MKIQIFKTLLLLLLMTSSLSITGCSIKSALFPQTKEIKENRNEKFQVSLSIVKASSTQEFSVNVSNNDTVFDLMKKLEGKNFNYKYKESNLGVFIEEINGVGNNSKQSMYWMLYVNDKLSDVGAAQYLIKPGDSIEWKYIDTSNIKL